MSVSGEHYFLTTTRLLLASGTFQRLYKCNILNSVLDNNCYNDKGNYSMSDWSS